MSLFALALAANLAGQTVPDPTEQDLRCIALIAQQIRETVRSDLPIDPALNDAIYYYIGRIEGRSPEIQTDTISYRVDHILTAPDAAEQLAPDAERCSAVFEAQRAGVNLY